MHCSKKHRDSDRQASRSLAPPRLSPNPKQSGKLQRATCSQDLLAFPVYLSTPLLSSPLPSSVSEDKSCALEGLWALPCRSIHCHPPASLLEIKSLAMLFLQHSDSSNDEAAPPCLGCKWQGSPSTSRKPDLMKKSHMEVHCEEKPTKYQVLVPHCPFGCRPCAP